MDVLSGRLLCGDCGGVLGGFGVVYVDCFGIFQRYRLVARVSCCGVLRETFFSYN